MFEDNMPMLVLTVTLVLIVLGVGAFAFMVTTSEIGYETTRTEEFAVTDPSVAQHCELDYAVDTINSVQQYNGYVWQAVNSAHYDLVGQVVVVQPAGMQG
jgi:hypothetical protein